MATVSRLSTASGGPELVATSGRSTRRSCPKYFDECMVFDAQSPCRRSPLADPKEVNPRRADIGVGFFISINMGAAPIYKGTGRRDSVMTATSFRYAHTTAQLCRPLLPTRILIKLTNWGKYHSCRSDWPTLTCLSSLLSNRATYATAGTVDLQAT